MTKARVYDLLLGAFVLAVLWPWLARGFVRPLSDHASDFGCVGMATLLLVRPRRLGLPSATRRVVITAALVTAVSVWVELTMTTSVMKRPDNVEGLINVRDPLDALACVLAAVVVIAVHLRLARSSEDPATPEPATEPTDAGSRSA